MFEPYLLITYIDTANNLDFRLIELIKPLHIKLMADLSDKIQPLSP